MVFCLFVFWKKIASLCVTLVVLEDSLDQVTLNSKLCLPLLPECWVCQHKSPHTHTLPTWILFCFVFEVVLIQLWKLTPGSWYFICLSFLNAGLRFMSYHTWPHLYLYFLFTVYEFLAFWRWGFKIRFLYMCSPVLAWNLLFRTGCPWDPSASQFWD